MMKQHEADDTLTLFTRISERFARIRDELIAYRERRRARHAQFLSDRDHNFLLILVLCALAVMLLDKYIPDWLNTVAWVTLLAALIFVWVRRFFRKAY